MRVLLSGSTGFIGSHVVRHLLDSGIEVAVTARRDVSTGGGQVLQVAVDDKLIQSINEFDPDVIVHCATHYLISHTADEIPSLIEANVLFGTRLLEAAAEIDSKFVTVSTAWQHFQGHVYSPVNLYAATKQAFDDIAVFYQSRGLELSRVTLFDTYGPGDRRRKIIARMMEAATSGEPLMASSGQQLIDLSYGDDVAATISAVATSDREDWPVDGVIRSGSMTLRDLALVVESAISRPVPIVWGALPDQDRGMRFDWSFGEPLAGWNPKTDLPTGLRITWESDWRDR